MAVSEATLRENYRRMPDEKLLRLAADDANKLRPEALALLRAELSSRGLGAPAEKAIEAQQQVLSEAGLQAYCAVVQAQPCPRCHATDQPLNATVVNKVASFVVMTVWEKRFAIACPRCLDQLTHDATTSSGLLGWWGFPMGIVRTIQAIIANGKMAKNHHVGHPNDLLKAFVLTNAGRIEAARDNPADLQWLLKGASRP